MTDEVDTVAGEAADAGTPQVRLAEIAFQRADLRALVAGNSSAYPGLLDWLASLDDAAVNAVLGTRSDRLSEPLQEVPTSLRPLDPSRSSPMPLSTDDALSTIPPRTADVLSTAALSTPFAVVAVAVSAVIVVAGAALAPSTRVLVIAGYLLYLVALLALGTTVRRKTVSAAIVGIVCVVPAGLDAVDPRLFNTVSGWLAFVVPGALVLSWLVARDRDPATYLIAPTVVLASFGWYAVLVALVTVTNLPGDSAIIRLASPAGAAAIIVGGCWLARALSLRRRPVPPGSDNPDTGSWSSHDAPIPNIDNEMAQR